MLAGFIHRPGVHCGSSALRAALLQAGLALSEELVFGLGAGLGFSLWEGDVRLTPPQAGRLYVGRSTTFENDLAESLGAGLHVLRAPDAEAALEQCARLLALGTLPLVYTDLFHLPYLGARGHWTGHLVALPAVGPEESQVSDNERPALETVPTAALRASLCGPEPSRLPGTRGCTVLWFEGVPRLEGAALAAACERAVVLQRHRMHALPLGGLQTLADLPAELASWEKRSDWKRCLRLFGQSIELRGCGGGLFRRLYGRFLGEAGRLGARSAAALVGPCFAAADRWTRLALCLEQSHARELPDLREAQALAAEVVTAERALFATPVLA